MNKLHNPLKNINRVTWIISLIALFLAFSQMKTIGSVVFLIVICLTSIILFQLSCERISNRIDYAFFAINKISREELLSHLNLFGAMLTEPLKITIAFSFISFDEHNIFPLSFNAFIAFVIGSSFQLLVYLYTDKRWFVDKAVYFRNSAFGFGLIHFFIFTFSQLVFFCLFI